MRKYVSFGDFTEELRDDQIALENDTQILRKMPILRGGDGDLNFFIDDDQRCKMYAKLNHSIFAVSN